MDGSDHAFAQRYSDSDHMYNILPAPFNGVPRHVPLRVRDHHSETYIRIRSMPQMPP